MNKIMENMTHMQKQDSFQINDEICPTCGGRTSMEVELFGKRKIVPVACKCKTEEYERLKQQDKDREKQIRVEKLFNSSMMGAEFKNATLDNFEEDEHNGKFFIFAKNYIERWPEMKRDNMGITLMGNTGIGKSYVSFMIANEIMRRYMTPVIAISTIKLINKIYESYSKYGEQGESQIISSLQNADLLILDDLGAEGTSKTGKEKQIIYSVIDERLREKKPMILTTNLSTDQLRAKLCSQDGVERTFDRIVSACPIEHMTGTPRRIKQGQEKRKILNSLFVERKVANG